MNDGANRGRAASYLRWIRATLGSGRKPVYYASALIGLAAGLAAITLKSAVHAVAALKIGRASCRERV